MFCGMDRREASWSAVALYRFALERFEVKAKCHTADGHAMGHSAAGTDALQNLADLPSAIDGREAS